MIEKIITNDRGAIYHLNMKPEELGDIVILVGDQGRVSSVSQYFDHIEHQANNREFRWATGTLGAKKITVLSTGIGADNIDIVMNELEALANFDLIQHRALPQRKALTLVRIGTCGTIQGDIEVGSYCLSQYAVGMDNTIRFYQGSEELVAAPLSQTLEAHLDYGNALPLYSSPGDNELLLNGFAGPEFIRGITLSAPGFYGPQGRARIMPPRFPALYQQLGSFVYHGRPILNFEMEAAPIYAFAKLLGHRAATVCLVLANRITDDFLPDYQPAMDALIRKVLANLKTL